MYGSSCDRESLYEELSFRHYLRHYSGTTITTHIQLCPRIRRLVGCNEISFNAVKSWLEIAFRPVRNSLLLYPFVIQLHCLNYTLIMCDRYDQTFKLKSIDDYHVTYNMKTVQFHHFISCQRKWSTISTFWLSEVIYADNR